MKPWLMLAAVPALAAETGFLDREVTLAGETHRYQVYVPRDYTADRDWPVIVFLHGAGESGANGLTQTLIGLPAAVRRNPERFPAILVLPQSSPTRQWINPVEQDHVLASLDRTMKEFRSDPRRVYLTGLSKGGYGTWYLAARAPERFAAIVPICGGVTLPQRALERLGAKASDFPSPADIAKKLGSLPVWAFHGGADATVPPERSREAVEALKAEGGSVKYTEYEGVGHNSWDKAYAEPDLAPWLFAQKRP
jgi:predicted peptidase